MIAKCVGEEHPDEVEKVHVEINFVRDEDYNSEREERLAKRFNLVTMMMSTLELEVEKELIQIVIDVYFMNRVKKH